MSEIPGLTTHEEGAVIEPRVRALDYVGGEGGFCEPLVITDGDEQFYVLHQAYLDFGSESGMTHRKVTFGSREELEEAFDEVLRRLTINRNLDWEETDMSLGFDIPAQEMIDATTAICLIPSDKRRPKSGN